MAPILKYEYKPGEELTIRLNLRGRPHLLPEETREHLSQAAVEVLSAVRAGLESLIARLEPAQAEAASTSSSPQRRRIRVE